LALGVALLLPLGEVSQSGQLGGVLHPLDDLLTFKENRYKKCENNNEIMQL